MFFDLSGSSLTKMKDRLARFKEIFWWSGAGDSEVRTPDNDPSAFVKLVFGSDSGLDGIDRVIGQYRARSMPVMCRSLRGNELWAER